MRPIYGNYQRDNKNLPKNELMAAKIPLMTMIITKKAERSGFGRTELKKGRILIKTTENFS